MISNINLFLFEDLRIYNPIQFFRTRKATALSLTLLLSDTDQEAGEAKENEQGVMSQAATARLVASMELLSEGFSTWEVYIKSSEVLRTLFMYAGDGQPSSLHINRTARTAIFHIANTHMPLVIGTLTYDMMNAQKMEDRLACMRVINMFARKVSCFGLTRCSRYLLICWMK
jgi:hypothetical protein